MKHSKKIGWISILVVLMFSIHPGIAGASHSTTLSFPGNGYVGVCLHTKIPDPLSNIFLDLTQSDIDHIWATATVDGVQGVIHADGYHQDTYFICWSDYIELCEPGSIRLFKPNKRALGYAELAGFGTNLSGIPKFLRHLLAYQLGNLMINTWIQEMLAYRGVPFDWNFMPSDDALYCSELLAHAWENIGSSVNLFPSQEACTLPGWEAVGQLLPTLGITISGDTAVYDASYILRDEIRPYFREIPVN